MADMVNIGGLEADLVLNTSKLEKGVENAERALFVIRQDIRQVEAALKRGEISIQDYSREILYLTESEKKLQVAMMTATSAVQQQSSALKTAGNSARDAYAAMARSNAAGMALMQLGFAIDDIQYGFRSVVNNIAPFTYSISTALGASAGKAMALASGVQIIGVLAYQAYQNWDLLMDAMGMGKVRTEAEEMDELAKKTGKTADETARLNKYKKEQLEIQNLMESQTKAEKDQERAVKEVLTEAGGDTVVGKLAQAIQAGGQGAKISPAEQKALDKIKAPSYIMAPDDPRQAAVQAQYQAKMDQINKRINDADIKRAQQLAVKAQNDPAALKSMIAKLSRVPGNEDLVANLTEQLPENKSKLANQQLEADLNTESRENYNKYLEQEKQKKDQAAKEEMDFDTNAQSVFKSAVNEAKGMAPGGDKIAQLGIMGDMLGGKGGAASAFQQIKEMMKSQGMNEGVAHEAATQVMKDAGNKTKEDVLNEMLNGTSDQDKEKATKSQQFDVMELAARVQAGVGGQQDEPKKQTGLMKRMVESLANIEKAKAVGFSS